jgi:hypothetical protein
VKQSYNLLENMRHCETVGNGRELCHTKAEGRRTSWWACEPVIAGASIFSRDISMFGECTYASHRCHSVWLMTYQCISLQVWVSLDLLRYSAQVCLEICDHLKIKLFRIPYSKASTAASTMSFSVPAGEKNGMGSQHHGGRSGGKGGRGFRKQHH